jgi:hypothetical protein
VREHREAVPQVSPEAALSVEDRDPIADVARVAREALADRR